MAYSARFRISSIAIVTIVTHVEIPDFTFRYPPYKREGMRSE